MTVLLFIYPICYVFCWYIDQYLKFKEQLIILHYLLLCWFFLRLIVPALIFIH